MLQNIDCLAHMLSYLTVRERESCRQVCLNWLMSADELARTQQALTVVGKRSDTASKQADCFSSARGSECTLAGHRCKDGRHSPAVPGHTVHWPYNFIRYHCFCLMLSRFPNVRSLAFEGIDHWNDHLLSVLTAACPLLKSLSFVRCVGIGRSRLLEKEYMNVTVSGWKQLTDNYGGQVSALTLQDCDLDEAQLALVIAGFRKLTYLDISSNRIGKATALKDLCATIRVLKVGPRLIGNNVAADIPIESILAGAGRNVSELYLQGFLSGKLSLVGQMPNLVKLTIRFMKPLFEDQSIIDCFAAIGRIHTLTCLEIYQHNTHDCYMALSRDHLMAIFTGCQQLERFVLNCDIWCDSPVDDQLLGHLRRSCPHLAHLDLCPGNFQTTDQSLQILATFPSLHYVRLVEFSGITELGLMHFLRRTPSLAKCTIEDCCDIHSENMIDFVRNLYFENPNRQLECIITPLRSLQIPTQFFRIPESNPKYRLTICGQKDRSASGATGWALTYGAGKILTGTYSEAYHSAATFAGLLLSSAISTVAFISTLLTFSLACCFYLLHLALLNVNSRFSLNGLVLGIPFLTTGTIVFLSSLFLGPALYLTSNLVSLFSVDLDDVYETFNRIYGDTGQ